MSSKEEAATAETPAPADNQTTERAEMASKPDAPVVNAWARWVYSCGLCAWGGALHRLHRIATALPILASVSPFLLARFCHFSTSWTRFLVPLTLRLVGCFRECRPLTGAKAQKVTSPTKSSCNTSLSITCVTLVCEA